MTANNCARVANRIAANFNIIAEHRTELLDASLNLLRPVMDDNKFFIGFHVTGDTPSSHMAVITEYTVANIVVVRGLYVIEQDHILQLHTVADDTVRSDKS